MHSIRKLIQLSTGFLEQKKIISPRLSAEELLAFVLKRKRIDLFMDYDAPIEKQEMDLFRNLIKRRANGEPLGYLLQSAEFLDCKLELTSDTFIPRQETEILVNLALKEISNEPKALWDLCTGSGCMGIAAKKHRPQLQVTLSDISKKALACAKKNAEKNNLSINYLQGDLLEPFQSEKADFILCNPPYVSEKEYLNLEKEIYFEPKQAHLAKEEGLEFYRRLALELPPFLVEGAKIFLEIGYNQKRAVMDIFNQRYWKQKRCEKDWAKKDRFFFLEFRSEFA